MGRHLYLDIPVFPPSVAHVWEASIGVLRHNKKYAIEDKMKSITHLLPRADMSLPCAKMLAVLPLAAFPTPLVFAQDEQPSTIYEEVVVTSSRIEQPLREVATSITSISKNELELRGYNSMADLLRTQMSVGVSNNGGRGQVTDLRIRGEESYRTKLLIDGMDMSDPSAPQVSPLFENVLSSYDIERVEVLRGPQGFMYGADAGGVVNIITSDVTDGVSGGFSAEGGSHGTQNFGGNINFGNEIAGLSLAVTDESTDGFNARADDTDLADDDGSDNTTVHLKGQWAITDVLNLTAVYRDLEMEYDFDDCSSATPNDCQGQNQQENTKLSLDYDAGSFTHQLSYAWTDVSRETFSAGVSTYLTGGETSKANYQGAYDFADSQTLVFGIDREDQEYGSNYGDQWDRDQTGVYAEYQQGWNDNLFVTAGLRRDDNSDFGTHTSYRVSAAYIQDLDAGNSFKYRATYGTGFRAPSLYEVGYNLGPYAYGDSAGFIPDAEESQGFDLGVDFLMENGTLIQATYFDQKVEDEIFFDPIGYQGYLQDEGETSSSGLEAALSYPINQRFRLSANYTYNSTDTASGEVRVRRPKHQANLSLGSRLLDGKLNAIINLRLSHDAEDVGGVPLDDYEVLDLSLNYDLANGFEVFGRVENLLDEDYVEVVNFNTAGRSAYAGVRYSF